MVLAERVATRVQPIEFLRGKIRGEVILPSDRAYEDARKVWNLFYDRFPGVIVRASDAADVIRAVNFANEHNLPVAVRGGKHGLGGHGTADGAVVVDLGLMRGIQVDAKRETVWVQAGATAGELTEATFKYGMAVPTGDARTVGISGLTLGGGIGWLVRKYGMTIDNLIAIECVTASGQFLTASADENPDLYWAMRGGHGNFAIATRFQFRMRRVSEFFGGVLAINPTVANVSKYIELARNAPDELTTIGFLMHLPPAPFVPEHLVGQLALMAGFAYCGDPAEGTRAIQPFRDLGAIVDATGPIAYPDLYALADNGCNPHRSSSRMFFSSALSPQHIEDMIAAVDRAQSPVDFVQFRVMGGAMGRVTAGATAFPHRDKDIFVAVIASWFDPSQDEEQLAWVQRLWAAVKDASEGVYVNFLGADGQERIEEAFGENYARLAALKARYDPDNVFHINHNIKPS